jgi:hypothetical protein
MKMFNYQSRPTYFHFRTKLLFVRETLKQIQNLIQVLRFANEFD